jgi:hypothetical protein
LSLSTISKLADMPIAALREVEARGGAAWKTNIESVRLKKDFSKNPDIVGFPRAERLSQAQWARGRVMAFVMKTKKVYYGADNDIRLKYGLV